MILLRTMTARITALASSLLTAVSTHRTARHLPLGLFLLGILAYGTAFAGYMLWHFDLLNVIATHGDDAFYYFQIAKNLADGHFSTFDGGITRTNGYHPLWLLLLTPVYWLCDPDTALFVIKSMEIMLITGAVALIVLAARLAHLPWVLLFAMLPMLYRYGGLLLGLEAAAAAFLLGLLFVTLGLFARNPLRWRWVLTGVVFVLPWVRLEYIAISLATTVALCGIEWAGRTRPAGWLFAGLFRAAPSLAAFPPLLGAGAGLLLYFAYNGLVFGGLVPVSGATKQLFSQMFRGGEGGTSFVEHFQAVRATKFFDEELGVALEVCVYFVLVWGVYWRFNNPKDWGVLVFLVGLLGLAAGHLAQFGLSVLTMGEVYLVEMSTWYYVPAYLLTTLLVPVRCYVAVSGIRWVLGPRMPRVAAVLKTGVLAATAGLLFTTADFSSPYRYIDERRQHDDRWHWILSSYAGTLLLNRILPEGSIIGSWDAGIIGYYSRFPVVNLDGLVNSYEYFRLRRERGVRATFVSSRDNSVHFKENVELFRRMFGITHFVNGSSAAADFENIYFETAPFLYHFSSPDSLAFMLWSEEPPRLAQTERDPPSWFWSRIEPHFDLQTEQAGVVVDGRIVQSFARACEADQAESALLVLLDRADRIVDVANPWENSWTTTRGGRPSSCVDALLLPKEARQPVRLETVSAINEVYQWLGDSPRMIRSTYDVYLNGDQLIYINKQCDQEATTRPFFVHVIPVEEADMPIGHRQFGVEIRDFRSEGFIRKLGDACLAIHHLPAYAIARIRTGQYVPDGPPLWAGEIRLDLDPAWLAEVLTHTEPVLRTGAVTVYHHANRLLYTSTTCSPDALAAPVFVHVIPVNPAALPASHRQAGFHNLDFHFQTRQLSLAASFPDRSPLSPGHCAALIDLPAYAIARIRTGQYVPDGPPLWAGEIRLDLDPAWLAEVLTHTEPVLRTGAVTVYHHANRLLYTSTTCSPDALAAPVFVHVIPVNPAALPASQRQAGFHNLDFHFQTRQLSLAASFPDRSPLSPGHCAALIDLPAYAIARIRTGQYVPDGPPLWAGEIRLDLDPAWLAEVLTHTEPVLRTGAVTVYHHANRLLYTSTTCSPDALAAPVFVHVIPVNPAALPASQRQAGFHNLDFHFQTRQLSLAASFPDRSPLSPGHCAALIDLPAYAIARIRTGQYVPDGPPLWAGEIRLDLDPAWLAEVLTHTEPVLRTGAVTVYHHANRLLYTSTTCSPDALAALVFVHVIPVNPAALPASQRQAGFHNLDFYFQTRQLSLAASFPDRSPLSPGHCAALIDLPAYAIARIRTGQYVPDGPQLWTGEFETGEKTP